MLSSNKFANKHLDVLLWHSFGSNNFDLIIKCVLNIWSTTDELLIPQDRALYLTKTAFIHTSVRQLVLIHKQLQSENTNVLIIKLVYKTIENKISIIIQCVYILGGPTNNILQISLSRIASARSLKCHLWRALLLSFLHLRSIPLIYIFVHAMTWGAIKKSYNY